MQNDRDQHNRDENNRKQRLLDALPFLVFALCGALVVYGTITP